MRLECYQSEELRAKIAEYEAAIGRPYPTDGLCHKDSTPSEIIKEIETLIAYGIDYSGDEPDDEIRWRNKCDEYRAYFGDDLPMKFGGPASQEDHYALMCECIERGEPYDPYEGIDGDPSDILF